MANPPSKSRSEILGPYLKSLREGKQLSLRDVEEASAGEVSNAYLSQLETGKIARPAPHVLHSLASVYGVPYEKLMERAGYLPALAANKRGQGDKHGRAATFSVDHLTADEEQELLKYLSFYRSKKPKT